MDMQLAHFRFQQNDSQLQEADSTFPDLQIQIQASPEAPRDETLPRRG